MKILVTGGAGFIASHLVDAYIGQGHEVFVVDNLYSGQRQNVNSKAHFMSLDINSPDLKDLIGSFKPQIVNHHAAQINIRASLENPTFDAQVNILGTLNLLEASLAAGSVQKIIFASTGGAIYGDADRIPTTETYPAWPISPYSIAKLSAEHYLHYFHKVHHLPYISLRYSNVYGPRQNPHGEAGVVAIFYQKARDSLPFVLNGSGQQTRDFVYVKDVVEANLKATTSKHTGLYNIGTGIETKVKDLIGLMQHTLDFDQPVDQGPAKSGEQKRSCLSYAKAKKDLGWRPQTSLQEGLAQTAAFFLT